jgi:hypothetical protein
VSRGLWIGASAESQLQVDSILTGNKEIQFDKKKIKRLIISLIELTISRT